MGRILVSFARGGLFGRVFELSDREELVMQGFTNSFPNSVKITAVKVLELDAFKIGRQ